jgi:hypothetical protein
MYKNLGLVSDDASPRSVTTSGQYSVITQETAWTVLVTKTWLWKMGSGGLKKVELDDLTEMRNLEREVSE